LIHFKSRASERLVPSGTADQSPAAALPTYPASVVDLGLRAVPTGISLRAVLGWSLGAALLVLYVSMLRRYSVNFPATDDYTTILNLPFNLANASTLREELAEILAFANDHRIVTLRLAVLLEAQSMRGLDFRLLMYAGSALLVLAGVLTIFTVERDARPLFAAITAAVLLSPANYEATFSATAAPQHFGVVAYAFAALYCLSRTGIGPWIGAGALALAAAGTSASGLMVVPAGALMLCLERRWQAAIVWTSLGAALFAIYFIGYEAPAYQASVGSYLRDPLVLLRFFLMAIGGIALSSAAALAVGVALSVVWIGLIASRRIRTMPPVLVAYAAFMVLSFAAIAWGRASFGDLGALLSRYRHYSEVLVLLSVAALSWQLPRAHRIRSMWALVPLSLVWLVISCRHELAELEAYFIDHRIRLDYYAAEHQSMPGDAIPALFRDYTLRNAREVGAYDPTPIANKPRTLSEETRALDATRPPPMRIDPPVAGKKAAIVYGQGLGHEHDAFIWLENGEKKYRGKLGALPPNPLAIGKRTGFLWGVYSLAGVTSGTYRVGVGTDDGSAAQVIWSNYSIDVE
jgi:hypothetical protein